MSAHDLTSAPQTDPTSIYRCRDGLYATDLLTVALVELDFFSWIADRAIDLREACATFDLQPRPVDVMLTLLCAMGLLEKSGGLFRLTSAGREHLVRSSPWFIGPYFASLRDRPVCHDLMEVLRTGRPANWGSQKDSQDWHRAMETPEFADSFTAAMDCRGVLLAQAVAKRLDLSRHRHLLDVAGGSGVYACALAAQNPHLHATVLEKPPVDRIAARAIEKRGFSERVTVLARDMLTTDLPAGADVHLYSNVLHDWDVPEVEMLVAKSAAALPAGGVFVMHDAFLNEDKTGPLHVAEYSVLLMHSSQGRCYGWAEMRDWLEAAGFRDVQYHDTAAARGILTAAKAG
jgi:hypothetical protein